MTTINPSGFTPPAGDSSPKVEDQGQTTKSKNSVFSVDAQNITASALDGLDGRSDGKVSSEWQGEQIWAKALNFITSKLNEISNDIMDKLKGIFKQETAALRDIIVSENNDAQAQRIAIELDSTFGHMGTGIGIKTLGNEINTDSAITKPTKYDYTNKKINGVTFSYLRGKELSFSRSDDLPQMYQRLGMSPEEQEQ